MSENENILLRRFVSTGDAEAFSEIVQRHAGLVYGACHRVLADKDRAADAVQETFLQLLRNAKNITGSVPMWLHRVATRKAIDVVRRDSSRKSREAKYAADKPQQVTKWQDLSRYVDEGLDDLDEQTRQILIRRFFEGRTTSDIAAIESVSQPTVSRRIDSGVNQLREKLRKRGVMVSAAVLLGLIGENVVQAAPALVLKELGKIALVGGEAAAATGVVSVAGSAASASGGGAKVAAGILAGVKAKVITAAAVTAIGVGSVVTYNHVTEPSAAPQPTTPAAAQQSTPGSSRSEAISAAPVRSSAAGDQEIDWSQFEGQMWEDIFAEEATTADAGRSGSLPAPPDGGGAEPTGGMMGGFGGGGGGFGGGSGGGSGGFGGGGGMMWGRGSAGALSGGEEGQYMDVTVDANESGMTVYRYVDDGSVRVHNVTRAEPKESEEEAP